MQNCYNILITGKVQDIGFRALVEDIAKLYDLRGFVFNDPNGSIKMVCCGDNGIITNFLEELEFKGTQRGAVVDEIKSEAGGHEIITTEKDLVKLSKMELPEKLSALKIEFSVDEGFYDHIFKLLEHENNINPLQI